MIALTVNGSSRQLELDTRTTLLDALREHIHLTGTKKGCDHGGEPLATRLRGAQRRVRPFADSRRWTNFAIPHMKISARNQLPGTVESVNADSVMAEVVVRLSGGETIVSAITANSAKRLGLAPGKAVTVLVKSTEVMLGVAD